MSEWLQMTILAVVQGLTEFLPVSSSGHLVLAKEALGFRALSGLGVELLLHGGTLVAVLIYYRRLIVNLTKGLWQREAGAWRFLAAIIASMVPAGLLGVLFEAELEALTEHPLFVYCALMATGLLLLSTRCFGRDLGREVTLPVGVAMGLAQAVAMLPGVSRSGSTLAISRFFGIDCQKAAAFSFLMVVPIIIAGNGLHLLKALSCEGEGAFAGLSWQTGLIGFSVAAVVGYASVAWMVRLLNRRHFWLFGFYCLAIGSLGAAYLLLR